MCGVSEELSRDRGPSFSSILFPQFFKKTRCVLHRLLSVAYTQSNDRTKLATKTAKWIVNNNTDLQGSLDNDKALRAIQ